METPLEIIEAHKPDASLSAVDNYRLREAIMAKQVDVLEHLLQNGVDSDLIVDAANSKSALCIAIEKDSVEMVKALLEHNAKPAVFRTPSSKYDSKWSHLKSDNIEMARILFETENTAQWMESKKNWTNPFKTPVMQVIRRHLTQVARFLIEQGANTEPELFRYFRKCALSEAVLRGHSDLADFLFGSAQQVGISEALVAAILSGCYSNQHRLELVKKLVAAGAEVNYKTGKENMTALMFAIERNNQRDVAEYLISSGADVNSFFISWYESSRRIHKRYFRGEPTSSSTRWSPSAKEQNRLSWAKFLVERGGNIDYPICENSTTLLMMTCWGRNTKLVEGLIQLGADVNLQDHSPLRLTPLHFATRYPPETVCDSNYNLVELLIKAGADAKREFTIPTPLMNCVRDGHIKTAKLLLREGADVNDGRTQSAIHVAIWEDKICSENCECNYDMVEALIKAGADVNMVSYKDRTPLMRCCAGRHFRLAKLLIDSGANVNACDSDGRTAFHYALFESSSPHKYPEGKLELTKVLLAIGSDLLKIPRPGSPFGSESPLGLALRYSVLRKHGPEHNVAELLADKCASSREMNESDSRATLQFAAKNGYKNLAEKVLVRGHRSSIHELMVSTAFFQNDIQLRTAMLALLAPYSNLLCKTPPIEISERGGISTSGNRWLLPVRSVKILRNIGATQLNLSNEQWQNYLSSVDFPIFSLQSSCRAAIWQQLARIHDHTQIFLAVEKLDKILPPPLMAFLKEAVQLRT